MAEHLGHDKSDPVAAVLRPGKRPTGAENAMILKRVLKRMHITCSRVLPVHE